MPWKRRRKDPQARAHGRHTRNAEQVHRPPGPPALTSPGKWSSGRSVKTSAALRRRNSVSVSSNRALGALERGGGQALPLDWWIFFFSPWNHLVLWHHIPLALVQLKGDLARRRKSVLTNTPFANPLRGDTFYTLEDLGLILLLGLLINWGEMSCSGAKRNPYI